MAGVFEEPVRLGMDASLTEERELPVAGVRAASRRTARVEVIPRRGPAGVRRGAGLFGEQ
jgi:hypothetical protein